MLIDCVLAKHDGGGDYLQTSIPRRDGLVRGDHTGCWLGMLSDKRRSWGGWMVVGRAVFDAGDGKRVDGRKSLIDATSWLE